MELRWLLVLLLAFIRCPWTHQRLLSSTEKETRSTGSVQECKVLVDKALEQYWEKKAEATSESESLGSSTNLDEENVESTSRDESKSEAPLPDDDDNEKDNNEADENDNDETDEDDNDEANEEDNDEEDDDEDNEDDEKGDGNGDSSECDGKTDTEDDDDENDTDNQDDDEEDTNGPQENEVKDEEKESSSDKLLRALQENEKLNMGVTEGGSLKENRKQDVNVVLNGTKINEPVAQDAMNIDQNKTTSLNTIDKEQVDVNEDADDDDDEDEEEDDNSNTDEDENKDEEDEEKTRNDLVNRANNASETVPRNEQGKKQGFSSESVENEQKELAGEIQDKEKQSPSEQSELDFVEDAEEDSSPQRSREHIGDILGEVEQWMDNESQQGVLKEIKKIEMTSIRPIELLYKYSDSTTRLLGDAEIFNKPILLFLGPWNSGKTSVINYILGIEDTEIALKTGTGITDTDFTVVSYGERHRVVSGTELAADWRYAGLQKFGQGFLDHFRSINFPIPLLEKVILVDTPGILENRKNQERGYSLRGVFQWFIDRADAVYVVLDPSKVDIGQELGSILELSRDARFLLNKADGVERTDLLRIVGQLFWNLSPLVASSHAPTIYAVSLRSKPFQLNAPHRFLLDQEKNLLHDIKKTLEQQIENRILYARKHAVRVRNHAKMVDCFLASYYRHKSIFSSKRNIAKLIVENPKEYNIYDGLSSLTNVSRYDMPNPLEYKEFFKTHPLYDFKPLSSTCSYFRGCPMDKLDLAITKEIPELLAKYKKLIKPR